MRHLPDVASYEIDNAVPEWPRRRLIEAVLERGIERRRDRSLILAILGFIAEHEATNLLASGVLVPSEGLLRVEAVRSTLNAIYGGADAAALDAAMAAIDRLRLGDLVPCDGWLGYFSRAGFLDIAGLRFETPGPSRNRRNHAWMVRGGLWASCCLDADERTALCRLARSWILAGNDMIGQAAFRVGLAILDRADRNPAPPGWAIAVAELVRAVDSAGGEPLNRTVAVPVLVEALRALEGSQVIGGIDFPGPFGPEIMVRSVLPRRGFQ